MYYAEGKRKGTIGSCSISIRILKHLRRYFQKSESRYIYYTKPLYGVLFRICACVVILVFDKRSHCYCTHAYPIQFLSPHIHVVTLRILSAEGGARLRSTFGSEHLLCVREHIQ
jgi:hypothetical protein